MNRLGRRSKMMMVALAAVALLLSACAGTPPQPGEPFTCVPDTRLETDIAPEAALEALTCSFKRWEGAQTLHFNVTVKNVSEAPQRFRVNIFLDNGKAVGGLIPRKIKKGLVPPGRTGSFVYPVKDMHAKPDQVFLKISTAGS